METTEEHRLITEATKCNDQQRLNELSNCVYPNVRRAIARNQHAEASTLNKMAKIEIASSVVYWLLENPRCTVSRELAQEDLEHRCVTCAIAEIEFHTACMHCSH